MSNNSICIYMYELLNGTYAHLKYIFFLILLVSKIIETSSKKEYFMLDLIKLFFYKKSNSEIKEKNQKLFPGTRNIFY